MTTTQTQISNIFNLMVQLDLRIESYHFGTRWDINRNIYNNFDPKVTKGRMFPAMMFDIPDQVLAIGEPEYDGTEEEVDMLIYFDTLQDHNNDGSANTKNLVEQWDDLKNIATDFMANFVKVIGVDKYNIGHITNPKYIQRPNLHNQKLLTWEVTFTLTHTGPCTEVGKQIDLDLLPATIPETDIEAGANTIDPCDALKASISFDDTCNCLFPSYVFSTAIGNVYDCLSQQQIDDIIDRNSITATFYDGTNEFTNLGTDPSLTFERTDPFSVGVWVLPNDLSGMQGIWSKYMAPTGIFGMIDSGTVRFDLQNNGATNGMILKTPSGLISGGVPFHVLFTTDGNGNIAGSGTYINGVLATKVTVSDTLTDSILTSTDFVLGGLGGGSTFMFNGLLNNFAIFDRELTAVEAVTIHGLGEKDPVYTAIPNLVSHLRLIALNPPDIIGVNNGTSFNQDITNIRKRLI